MFDILAYLVRQAGRVVGHQEFLDKIWGEATVTYAVLVQNIAALRRTLSEHAPGQLFIETIPKRGYRFLAEVSVAELPSNSRPSKSLAVLPMELAANAADDGQDVDLAFLKVAVADALSLRLGRYPDIAVRPFAPLQAQSSRRSDPCAIGRSIDVSYIVSGRLEKGRNEMLVNIDLIHVGSERIAWSGEFKLTAKNILAVEKKIVNCVYRVVTQNPRGETRNQDRSLTPNALAYQSYLRGRYFWSRRSTADLAKAIEYFEQSVEQDPDFGLAHTGVCDCHTMLINYGSVDPSKAIPRARAAAAKAMEICPEASEAHASVGYIRAAFDWDWRASEKAFLTAIELNPNNIHVRHWLAVLHLVMGEPERAIAGAEHAREVDPLFPYLGTSIALIRYMVGDFERAHAELNSVLELEGTFPLARLYLGRVYLARKQFSQAAEQFTLALDFFRNGFVEAELAQAEILAGARDRGERRLTTLLSRRKEQYVSPYGLAQVYDALGDERKTQEMLSEALGEHSISMMWIGIDPRFAGIRQSAFGRDLLARANHMRQKS